MSEHSTRQDPSPASPGAGNPSPPDPLRGANIGCADPLRGANIGCADPLRGANIGCADPLRGANIGCADIISRARERGNRLTLDEFLLIPAVKPAQEYERGTIAQKHEPGARHGILQGEIAALIELHGRPSWSICSFVEAYVT